MENYAFSVALSEIERGSFELQHSQNTGDAFHVVMDMSNENNTRLTAEINEWLLGCLV